ncbi:MAG: SPOR domain-containing protein, partial [Pseudomonadota bacterium]|nr:SPOR domain-containing protein [Pseudomonadota bacterium]
HPVRSIGLMRQAWADDNVTLPDPPAVRESAPPPAPVKKHAAGKTPAEKLSAVIIQAGSFSTQKNAQKLAAALAGIAPITVDEVAMGGRHWWRVRLGPFSSKAEAGSALAKARAHGVADARITHQ